MDVLLGCGELGVAHDLLNDAWRNILQGEGCCGCMAAGVGAKLSASGLFENGVILHIEFVLIDADQFFTRCVFAQVRQMHYIVQ